MKLSSLLRPGIWRSVKTGVQDALLQSYLVPDEGRPKLLRFRGARVGDRCILSAGLQASSPDRISIGDDCYMNRGCILQGEGGIEIGDKVWLGRNVSLITITHEIGTPERRAGDKHVMPVRVGKGSWLASNVTVLPGVTIGEGAIVGAGAVVTKDLAANALYVGVPAELKRTLSL